MHAHPLRYPFETPPDAGGARKIYPGLLWIRQSLPMALDHINVWLLSDERECVVVDTGVNNRRSKEAWLEILATHAKDRTINKVLATHLHPDHCGLAGWLVEKFNCPLYMTRTEYLLCRTLCFDSSLEIPKEAIDFYRAAGMTGQQLDQYAIAYGGFGRAVSPLPPSYRRIQDNDVLDLAGQQWTVMVGTGHSPEHACLYNESRNTLISGDQILPRISSIIAVWPTEPESNPLKDWLDSCRLMRDRVPGDALILPSHGLPFYGAGERLTQLIDHHEALLEHLLERCRTPQRVIDVFDLLFKSTINDSNLVMAVGEAIAHFNFRQQAELMKCEPDSDGVDWYSSS